MVDKNEMLRLYHEGKTDREIAQALRAEISQVINLRQVNRLAVHQSHRTLERIEYMITYARLYEQGYDNYSIARAVGVENGAMRRWRLRHGLPEVVK